MDAPDRVTIVLKARPGESLNTHVLPFLALGATIIVGRRAAIVSSVHEGDQVEQAHLLENQLTLAEAAIKRSVRPGSGLRIDDWIATVANARRYEWLRDRALQSGDANVPMVRCGLGPPMAAEVLDSWLDHAMVTYP